MTKPARRRLYKFPRLLSLVERMTELSYPELFAALLSLVIALGFLYFVLSTISAHHGLLGLHEMNLLRRLLNSLYFSVITATTVGYGDIVPLGIAKAVAGMEALFGYFCIGIFIAKIVSHKQEIAMQHVHAMSLENVFHKTREGLFIVRRDFDVFAEEIRKNGTLSEKSWTNFAVDCDVLTSYLESLQQFYTHEEDLASIDGKRERLLGDGFLRTFDRLKEILGLIRAKGITCDRKEEIHRDIRDLVDSFGETVRTWRRQARMPEEEFFPALAAVGEELKTLV